MDMLLEQLPKKYHSSFEAIADLILDFCESYLDDFYEQLCLHMLFIMCRDDAPINKGRPASWASGIVHAVGWVNFLHDPETKPYMSSADLAKEFGVSKGTMMTKSKFIRDGLELIPLDPNWCLPSTLEDNPLVWMVEVDGFMIDMRHASWEMQNAAYEKGLIPYIPERKKTSELESEPEQEPKILKFPEQSIRPFSPEVSSQPKKGEPDLFDGLDE